MKKETKIMSFVGGHEVKIFAGSTFDPAIRKFRGGKVVLTIPFAGRMLSAKAAQEPDNPVVIDGVEIPTMTPPKWESVDPIPPVEEAEFCIVSAMFATAAKELGLDTSRLLTLRDMVVDDEGRVCGALGFNRN